jgi:hypothetical protein
MKIPFDEERAIGSLVHIVHGRKVQAMGFRFLDDDLIVTACHCLPRRMGKVILPSPDDPGGDRLLVLLRRWQGQEEAFALIRSADPCSDLAILANHTASGAGIEPERQEQLWTLLETRVPARMSVGSSVSADPGVGQPVYIFTHRGAWIQGEARRSSIRLNQGSAIESGTSGAPVFDTRGRGGGVISTSTFDMGNARMCRLSENLPGWALRLARRRPQPGRSSPT